MAKAYGEFFSNSQTTDRVDQEKQWLLLDGKAYEKFRTIKGIVMQGTRVAIPRLCKRIHSNNLRFQRRIRSSTFRRGHPYCFISRTFNRAEKNYSTTKKKLLAIVWTTQPQRQYLLGRTFIIQTNHQALEWLHNVKYPSLRILRWRLRLQEFRYRTIECIKGKENGVNDCLSRLFPVKETEGSLLELIDRNEIDTETIEDIQEIAVYSEIRDLYIPKPPIEQHAPYQNEEENLDMASLVEDEEEPQYDKSLHNTYLRWTTNRTTTRAIKKPNAGGKQWKKIQKRPSCKASIVVLPPYNEGKWLTQLQEVINVFKNRRLIIDRLHFLDPTITGAFHLHTRSKFPFRVFGPS